MQILIVDDDRAHRYLLSTILKLDHHEIVEASDGLAAWEIIQKNPLPFVITDWMMPDLDGPELVRRIRAAHFEGYTYIIVLSARDAQNDIVRGLEGGADDYLTKPFDPGELRARVAIGVRILTLETRLRQAMKQLELMATHDCLTGLLTRRALYEQAAASIARAQREQKPISMLMIDLDYFKNINDTYGHLVGDQVLDQTAKVIQSNVRSYDLAGRWGGEEFMVILPTSALDEAYQAAERLRIEISKHPLIIPDGSQLTLHASLGVSILLPDSDITFEQLIQQADEALYQAKKQGRNRVCIYQRPPDTAQG